MVAIASLVRLSEQGGHALLLEQPDQEPQDDPEASRDQEQPKASNKRRSFANARRELSEKELSTPAVQKLLIDEVERLEAENTDLQTYRARFYSCDRRLGVLEEKHRRVISHEIISNGCLIVGAAAIGYIPSISADVQNLVVCATFGVILVIAGIWAKVVRL